jgi:hypothetical protein
VLKSVLGLGVAGRKFAEIRVEQKPSERIKIEGPP